MTGVTVRSKAKKKALDIFLSTPSDGEMTIDDIIDGAMNVFLMDTKDAVSAQNCLIREGIRNCLSLSTRELVSSIVFKKGDKMITPAGVVFLSDDGASIDEEIAFVKCNFGDYNFVLTTLEYLIGYFEALAVLSDEGSIELLMSRKEIDRMIAYTLVFTTRLTYASIRNAFSEESA